MPEFILAAVAWPYANSHIHVGNITGSYLPADIFTRYHRLKGNHVLMVSGSDAHGTPVTVRADGEKTSPLDIYQKYHSTFLDLFQKVGLSYDLFTSTHTTNHFKVAQNIFLALKHNGYLYTEKQMHWYSPTQQRYLPDRYIEGTCYLCGYENARGDQCDQCGNLLDATLIKEPRSKIDGSTPELRETEHFYLDLHKLQPMIVDFLNKREKHLRPNVLRQSLGQILANDLHGRAITRDLDWGIPVPVNNWDGKCLYVWFEAVIGYLSATIEWSNINNQPDNWKNWWFNDQSKGFYFIGKDNIPFHAVIWPGQLIGCEDEFSILFDGKSQNKLTLPYDIPANEFMNLEGQKISGSRNWAIWGLDFLKRYDPDPLRFYLTVNMPETKDTDWDWQDFYNRNNNELVATWGNLANRVLTFAHSNWDGHVPEPGELSANDLQILTNVEKKFFDIGIQIEEVKLRAALNEALQLASEANRYLENSSPWIAIKNDKQAAATSIYVSLKVIDSLKTIFSPFLPFSSEMLNTYLGYEQSIFGEMHTKIIDDELGTHEVLMYQSDSIEEKWHPSDIKPGQSLLKPEPLFKKLDETIVIEERSKLGVV